MAVIEGRTWSVVLSPGECRHLLGASSFGRIGVHVGGHVEIFPVNYALDGDDVVVRVDRGTKHGAITKHPGVAFEIDDVLKDDRTGWSVLVVGDAAEVLDPFEIIRLGKIGLQPWAHGEKSLWVRIVPHHVSGRRIQHLQHRESRSAGQESHVGDTSPVYRPTPPQLGVDANRLERSP